MPFTVSPAAYKGGDYLFQGITNAAQGITGAIKQYTDLADQTTQSDALMKYLSQQNDPTTGKPIISPGTLQDYQNHSMRQRAFIAGGMQAGNSFVQALQHASAANRETLQRGNAYQAAAVKSYADAADTSGGGGADSGKIWCNELNGYATATQCNNARLKTTTGQLQQNYGLPPDALFNSAIHEAGNVTTDATSGARTFNPDANGSFIRIGARDPNTGVVDPNKGVFMPMQEFNIYKRQLGMTGFQPGGAGGGAASAGGGSVPVATSQSGGVTTTTMQTPTSPQQQQAVAILTQNGKPLTPANIAHVVAQLSGGQ
jgi:hypothetical protein